LLDEQTAHTADGMLSAMQIAYGGEIHPVPLILLTDAVYTLDYGLRTRQLDAREQA
jgi:hypothetical protein